MVVALLLAGLVVAGAAPAPAASAVGAAPREGATATSTAPVIPRVEWAYGNSPRNTNSAKYATAMCPWGMQVTGGHGEVSAETIPLTRLEPIRQFSRDSSGNVRIRYGYRVEATTPYTTGTSSYGDWSVHAQATCVDPVPGYHIARATTPPLSTNLRQTTTVACESGERALGTGARIGFYRTQNPDGTVTSYNHGISLQVAMASSDGTYARARASVVPGGYPHPWQITAYAVCADTPYGYRVNTASSSDQEDELEEHGNRIASTECGTGLLPGGTSAVRKLRLAAGGGVSDDAPINVELNGIFTSRTEPFTTYRSHARAQEIVPTSAPWHVTAQVICAL